MSLASPARTLAASTAADARAALVAALASVGLDAAPVAPDNPTAGAAWPQWQQTEWNGHLASLARYSFSVFVVLNAGDFASTVDAADEVVSRVTPALWPLVVVQAAEPVQITFGEGTTMPGVRFRVVTRT